MGKIASLKNDKSLEISGDIIEEESTFDISTFSALGHTFDTSSQLPNKIRDMAVSSDGYHLYVLDSVDDLVYQYDMTTAYDLTTITYNSKYCDISTYSPNSYSVYIGNNNNKLYVADTSYNIDQYDLSTTSDISTSSYIRTFDASSEVDDVLVSLCFNSNGKIMYVLERGGSANIFQYTLGTAWNISTATYSGKSVDISSALSIVSSVNGCISVSSNGIDIFIAGLYPIGAHTLSLGHWQMSVNSDISTASYIGYYPSLNVITLASDNTKPFGALFYTNIIRDYEVELTGGINKLDNNGDLYSPEFIEGSTFKIEEDSITAIEFKEV